MKNSVSWEYIYKIFADQKYLNVKIDKKISKLTYYLTIAFFVYFK